MYQAVAIGDAGRCAINTCALLVQHCSGGAPPNADTSSCCMGGQGSGRTLQGPRLPPRSLRACSYHRLFTVNATCTAPDKEQYGAVLERVVQSFRPPPVAIV